MKILISYRGAPRIRGWETGAMLSRAFRKLGHEVDEYAKIYERPEWVANRNDMLSNSYDLHVYCECNDGDAQYLELKEINATKRVAWLFDIAMLPDFYKRLVQYMDFQHCYVANPDYLSHFKCPASYLPYAADLDLFHCPLTSIKKRDVCLAGSDRPERKELIKTLQKRGINAELIHGVFKEDYIAALGSSKIVINDLAGGGSNLLSMRAFEATAAGAALVQARTPTLYMDFEVGTTCEEFWDTDSLINVIDYLLSDEHQLYRIAANGQYWTQNHHTYLKRAQEILDDY